MIDTPVPGCYGCIDWAKLGTVYVCNYSGRTGQLRSLICRHGEYCTVKSTHAKNNGENNRKGAAPLQWDEGKALGIYRMGGNDAEIAAAVGTSKHAICAWRRRRALKANYTPSPKGGEPAL